MKSRISVEGILSILLLLSIASGLIVTEYFYNPVSSAFYSFTISSLVFVTATVFFLSKDRKTPEFKAPILLFCLWFSYVFVSYLTNKTGVLITIYMFVLYLLLRSSTVLFSSLKFKLKPFFYGIIILSIIESLYCILQFLGVCKSHSHLFSVTGSYNNPNVTAIFLSLTTPVFLYSFREKYKKLIRISFLVLLIALFLLKCRAAFIGVILASVVFYSLEYNMISWIKNNKSKPTAKALVILSLLIIIPLSSYLYNAKKASADGRKFIWKVSSVMAMEKPLTGYGYGYFEKEYNLYQADYIKDGKATAEELKNVGPVIMPHNELLHNLVEGGFIGLLLTGLFFGSLFFAAQQRTKTDVERLNAFEAKDSHFNISYAGVIAFIGMSMVNSTIQIMPIMALLIIYAGIICSTSKPLLLPSFLNFRIHSAFPIILMITTIAFSCFLVWTVSGVAIADRENKKASLLQQEKRYKEALQIMHGLENHLNGDPNYWKNLGIIYMKANNYPKAINCFSTAKKWSSLPDLYLGSGMCYERLYQYPKAITEYKQLVLLLPSKFGYRFRLMQAYFKNKDTANTIITAKEILSLEAKIPSTEVKRYKKIAWSLLKKIESKKVSRQKKIDEHEWSVNVGN